VILQFSSGRQSYDVMGGNLPYSAVGLAVWEPDSFPGLIAREMIIRFMVLNASSVVLMCVEFAPYLNRLIHALYIYIDRNTRLVDDPVAHLPAWDCPSPSNCLVTGPQTHDGRTRLTPYSLRQVDIPEDYLDATAAHLCPVDYLTHTSYLPFTQEVYTITWIHSAGTMTPTFYRYPDSGQWFNRFFAIRGGDVQPVPRALDGPVANDGSDCLLWR
jgi:hypothetical protein